MELTFILWIMGHEIAGEICKIGDKVKKFKIGDLVSFSPYVHVICHSCKENKYATCTKYKYYGSRNMGGFLNIFQSRSGI